MNRVPVLIAQRALPPYRLAFFQELARSPRLDPTFAYGTWDALENVADPAGLRVERLGIRRLSRRANLWYQPGLGRLVRSGAYRCVITEFNPRVLSNLTAALDAARLGVRFVWWGHGIGPRAGDLSARARVLLCKLAHAVIFYSADQAERFVRLGLPRAKAFVAWNSIDTEEIGRRAAGWDRGRRNRVLYVGRLVPNKKVDLLLRAFALAGPGLAPDARVTVVGDGPERGRLEALARDLGVAGRVDFRGSLYDEGALAECFNAAAVSVSPGCVGLSAVHSLAYGVPMLVARDEPHGPEQVVLRDGVSAAFCASDDPRSLADGLVTLLRDGQRLGAMGEAGRRIVGERFSVSAMAASFERAVAFALSGNAPAGSGRLAAAGRPGD